MTVDEIIAADMPAYQDVLIAIARHLGVIGDVEDTTEGFRPALLACPELHIVHDEHGVLEVTAFDIQEGCLRAIDNLKNLIYAMNNQADEHGLEQPTAFIQEMSHNYPMRAQEERYCGDD